MVYETEISDPSTTAKPQAQPTVELRPSSMGPTVEQSVKIFKVFEVLRGGDKNAIEQALVKTSQSPLEGTTFLHLAIQCAEPEVVEHILTLAVASPVLNVDVNGKDRDGNTPLHLAATLSRASTVHSLLQLQNINDSIANYHGQTPLDLARTPEIFQMLQLARSIFVDRKVKEAQKLLHEADYDGLEKLLEDSRDETSIDADNPDLATEPVIVQSGGTLLHQAARNRDLRLIQLLLLHGADPFRRDRDGRLPQDVTKDDRTRSILKKSPAATAAQRGIQEKAILGASASQGKETVPGGKESREMKGYLKKWTNYTTGYKLRWFVLEDGVLSYYKHQGTSLPLHSSMICLTWLR